MDSTDEPPKSIGPPASRLEAARRDALGRSWMKIRPKLERTFRGLGLRSDELVEKAMDKLLDRVLNGKNFDPSWLDDPTVFEKKVYGLVAHVYKDALRDNKAAGRFVSIDAKEQENLAARNDPHALLEGRELRREATKAYANLSGQQRAVVALFHVGLAQKEYAAEMNVERQTATSYLKEARKRIREALKQNGFDLSALAGGTKRHAWKKSKPLRKKKNDKRDKTDSPTPQEIPSNEHADADPDTDWTDD